MQIFILFLLLSLGFAANAAETSQASGILDETINSIKGSVSTITSAIIPHAISLFGILALIEVSIIGITLVLKGAEMQETVAELAKKIFWFGLIIALIYNAGTWYDAIIKSMSQIGASAGLGATTGSSIGPSGMIESALEAADKIFQAAKYLPWDAFGAAVGFFIAAGIIVVSGFVAAAFIFIAMAESVIVTGVVALMIAMGTTRFTADFVSKSFSYAVSIAIKLLFVFIVAGLGTQMVDTATTRILTGHEVTLLSGLAVAGLAVLSTILVMQIPSIASAALSGAPAMNVGSLTGNAMALGAAGAAVGGAAAYAASQGKSVLATSLAQTAAAGGRGASSMGVAASSAASLGSKVRGLGQGISDGAGAAVSRESAKIAAFQGGMARMSSGESGVGKASGVSTGNLSSQTSQASVNNPSSRSSGGLPPISAEKYASEPTDKMIGAYEKINGEGSAKDMNFGQVREGLNKAAKEGHRIGVLPEVAKNTNAAVASQSSQAPSEQPDSATAATAAAPVSNTVGALAQPKITGNAATSASRGGGMLKDAIKGGAKQANNLANQEWAAKSQMSGIQVRLDV